MLPFYFKCVLIKDAGRLILQSFNLTSAPAHVIIYTEIERGTKEMMNPVAFHVITNNLTLVLYEYNGEIALTNFVGITDTNKPKVTKVFYTAQGRPYIVRYKTRFYLDEFTRA